MRKVRIVCGRVASPGVVSSRRFDNPFSVEAYGDFVTIMRVWDSPGVIQKGDFTDTVVSFDLRQRRAKLTFRAGLELYIFRRVRVWVAKEHFNILIRRNQLCTTTGNDDDRGCR